MCTKPIPGSRSLCSRPWSPRKPLRRSCACRPPPCRRCCRGSCRAWRRRAARGARSGGGTGWRPTAMSSTLFCAITTSRDCRSAASLQRKYSRARRCNPSRFERHHEAVPDTGRLAAMAARNATYDRQAETAVERLEDFLALRFRHARALVAYADLVARHTHLNRRFAMTPRVFKKVADHAAQQPRLALYSDGFAFQRCLLVARAFFPGEGPPAQGFGLLHALRRVAPARQHDFVDQRVELGQFPLALEPAPRS